MMQDLDMESFETDDPYNKETIYFHTIKKQTNQNCWFESKCEPVCETITECGDCQPSCYDEEICEEVCEDIIINDTTGETEQICSQECNMKETCVQCEESCYSYDNCYDKCEDEEKCEDFDDGELRLEGRCGEEGSDIYISAWGQGLDSLNHLNEGGEWNCEDEMNELVNLRKAFQKDVNNEFAIWFFEDFITGEDYDKIINGEWGFRGVLNILLRNEEDIADRTNCVEGEEWPEGFEVIDISYKSDNANIEVWEKKVPVEWSNTRFHTTLYKYSWIPDKQMLKGMINYELSETDTFGPSAKDIAKIKEDEGQMELINSLSGKVRRFL
jgi:hypothetical protein|tara:strand:- start:1323 stop:2306 length:984 start_codon:yes stop_codon:yes gene_type:complete